MLPAGHLRGLWRSCAQGDPGRQRGPGLGAQSDCSCPQVSAAEDGAVIKDTNVVLEIPAPTTIAYGVIELYVKLDGRFGECCLWPGLLADWAEAEGGTGRLPWGAPWGWMRDPEFRAVPGQGTMWGAGSPAGPGVRRCPLPADWEPAWGPRGLGQLWSLAYGRGLRPGAPGGWSR